MNSKQFLGTIVGTIVRIVVAAVIIYVVFRLSVGAYNFGYQIFADVPVDVENGRMVNIVITEGESTKEIAEALEKKGLINDAGIFVVQEKLSEYKDMIKPGSYQLSTSMSAVEMLSIMSSGETNIETDTVEE